MGVHEDLSDDKALSALSAADSGTGESDEPPKPDTRAPAPVNCTQEANGPAAADDVYERCVIKAKECYNGANDPAVCDQNWKICDALKKAPDPAQVEAQRKADYAACLDKAKYCYEYESNTEICDQQRESCELVWKG